MHVDGEAGIAGPAESAIAAWFRFGSCACYASARRPRHRLRKRLSLMGGRLAARPGASAPRIAAGSSEPTGCSAFYEADSLDPAGGFFTLDDDGQPMAGRDRAAAARDDAAWPIAPPSASCWAAPAPTTSSITGWTRSGSRHRDPRTAGISGRSTPTARASATSSPMATPSCCSRPPAPNAPATPTPTGCSPTSPKCWTTRFWEARHGASAEEFREDWTPFSAYRGQNANMHLTEALMAAFEATGERAYLAKAESIADLILRRRAGARGLARARALPRRLDASTANIAAPTCSARSATRRAMRWNGRGSRCNSGRSAGEGSTGCRGRARGCSRKRWRRAGTRRAAASITRSNTTARPRVRDRLWWPICEGDRRRAFPRRARRRRLPRDLVSPLLGFRGAPAHRRPRTAAGAASSTTTCEPIPGYFVGKPDIYHALQACLIPLYGPTAA